MIWPFNCTQCHAHYWLSLQNTSRLGLARSNSHYDLDWKMNCGKSRERTQCIATALWVIDKLPIHRGDGKHWRARNVMETDSFMIALHLWPFRMGTHLRVSIANTCAWYYNNLEITDAPGKHELFAMHFIKFGYCINYTRITANPCLDPQR